MSIFGNPVMMGGPGGGETIVPKTITANGTYNALDDNADGYDPVVVNVSGGTSAFTNVEPLHVNVNNGYLGSPSQFSYEANSPSRYDVYPVTRGKHYLAYLGATVGNRFRSAYFAEDPATFTTSVGGGGAYFYTDQPVPYMVALTAYHMLTPEYDGYLMIQKNNYSDDTIKTYVVEYVEP